MFNVRSCSAVRATGRPTHLQGQSQRVRGEIEIGLGFKAPRAEIPYGRVLVPFLSYLT